MKTKLMLGAAAALMLSAVTSNAQSLPPIPQGNHYVCYPAQSLEKPIPRPVAFKDQFGVWSGTALQVTRICVPAEKRYKDRITPIVDPALHLVCYAFRAKGPMPPMAITNDQFTPQRIRIAPPTEVCLPAGKIPLKD